jgi:hypothetical protein
MRRSGVGRYFARGASHSRRNIGDVRTCSSWIYMLSRPDGLTSGRCDAEKIIQAAVSLDDNTCVIAVGLLKRILRSKEVRT